MFISVIVRLSSHWSFFIFFVFVEFSLCSSFLFSSSDGTFMIIILICLLATLLFSFSLVLFLRFCLVFHLEDVPLSLIFQILCVYFYVLCRFVTSPNLEEVVLCSCPLGQALGSLPATRARS